MKNILVFLIIAGLIGGGVYFFVFKEPEQLGIDHVIPGGVLFYSQSSDIEKNLNKMASTQIWKSFSSINYDLILEKNKLPDDQADLLKEIQSQMKSYMTNPLLKRFFDKDVALAIYPVDIKIKNLVNASSKTVSKALLSSLSSVVLITRLAPEAQFVEFLTSFAKEIGTNVSIDEIKYNKHKIRIVTVSGFSEKIYYIRIEDLLVVSIGDRYIKKSLDVFDQEANSLHEESQFLKLKQSSLKPTIVFTYWNMGRFFALLKGQMEDIALYLNQNSNQANEDIDEMFKSIDNFKTIAMSARYEDLMSVKFNVGLNPNSSDLLISAYQKNCRSSENKSLNFIPRDVLVYQWWNCIDVGVYWEQMLREIESGDARAGNTETQDRISSFEAASGISIRGDVIPAFGEEFGGFLSDIQSGGLFPIPKFLIFVSVGNRQKIEQLLSKGTEHPMIMLQEEQYSGQTIHYVTSPLGSTLQPSYAFVNDYLLFAINTQLIKDSIDALNDKSKSLLASENFKRVNIGLTDLNTGIQYAKFGELVKKLENIIEWSNDWVGAKDEQTLAFQAGSEQRLAFIEGDIALKKQEIKEKNEQKLLIEDKIWDLEDRGIDAADKNLEMEQIIISINQLNNNILANEEQAAELRKIVEGYDQNKSLDAETRRFYLDEVVYPMFRGLQSITTYGQRQTVEGMMTESTFYLDVK